MKKENEEPVKSALAIAMGCLILFLLTGVKWLLFAGLIIGVTGLFSSYLTDKIHWTWMKLAYLLNLVVPKIILGVVFYFFLTPVSFLARLFRRNDPLLLEKKEGSTFIQVDKTYDRNSFTNTW